MAVLVAVVVLLALVAAWFLFTRDHDGDTTASPSTGVTSDATQGGTSAPEDTSTPDETSSPDETSTPEETSTSEETTSATGHEQATMFDALIAAGKPSRGALGPALQEVIDCTSTEEGIATIRRVARSRHDQGVQARRLAMDAIEDGESIKRLLIDALDASERADRSYLRWAERYASGDCGGAADGDPDYDAGNAASGEATTAKAALVAAWNPIAEEEGLPTRREADI